MIRKYIYDNIVLIRKAIFFMNKYMKEADKLARCNNQTNDGGPFGAVVVRNGEIIGRGSNQVLKTNDPTAHAEILAIREACQKLGTFSLEECELYSSCYPCPMCLSAIIWSNIKVVYYGNTKEDARKIGFRDDMIYDFIKKGGKSDILNFIQIDREETIKAFNEFNEKENKIIY